MRILKISLVSAFIMSFLLLSANGALAAYTGLYTNAGGLPSVQLESGAFAFGGTHYEVNDLENGFWSAAGAGNNFYGFAAQGSFVFINSPFGFTPTEVEAVLGDLNSFINSSLELLDSASDFESALNDIANDADQLIASVWGTLGFKALGLINAPIGFGTFYNNGDKFDLYTGALALDGLGDFVCAEPDTYTRHTPIPGAAWLLGSGLVGLVGLRRRMKG